MAGPVVEFLKTPFNRYLAAFLIILGILLLASEYRPASPAGAGGNLTVHFFFSPSCPHCAEQAPFNAKLEGEFPGVAIVRHDVTIPEESRLLLIMAQNFSLGPSSLGTPATIVGNRIFLGFDSEATTGEAIRGAIRDCLAGSCGGPPEILNATAENLAGNIDLPLLGRTDLSGLSLPLLAAVLGLIDGFNPCAMWVLVYLISLLMNLNDKRKLAIVTGVFLLASGILYFLFMTAWLNAFLFLGYVRAVTIIVGLVALGGGILSIKEYLDTKGAMVCTVVDIGGRKKLAGEMRSLAAAPLTWLTLAGIVALAFTVNSVEFVCSSALPAIFTRILTLSHLQPLEYYAYIALYDFFFMLDDLLVFGSALLVFGNVGQGYARYCKIIGGAILLVLGVLLLFSPQFLR